MSWFLTTNLQTRKPVQQGLWHARGRGSAPMNGSSRPRYNRCTYRYRRLARLAAKFRRASLVSRICNKSIPLINPCRIMTYGSVTMRLCAHYHTTVCRTMTYVIHSIMLMSLMVHYGMVHTTMIHNRGHAAARGMSDMVLMSILRRLCAVLIDSLEDSDGCIGPIAKRSHNTDSLNTIIGGRTTVFDMVVHDIHPSEIQSP